MELLLGCGHRRDKRVVAPGTTTDWQQLVTLDHNQACQPDLLCDLQQVPWAAIPGGSDVHSPLLPMILSSDTYDEVHAYEVLEHVGRQGDARAFFDTFSELWRILKPGGMVCATVPSRYSPWLWGDPGHTRAILRESLVFLDYSQYEKQQTAGTSMSDYRYLSACDFELLRSDDDKSLHRFILKKVTGRLPHD